MSARGQLRVVPQQPEELLDEVRFCGYCGHPAPAGEVTARICGDCGLGVVLSAPAVVAPRPGHPAIVLDHTLSVCALSQGAEKLLGITEPEAVNRHISELIVPAHAEARSLDSLVSAVVSAARGDAAVERIVVRPTGEFGVRYAVRISTCGPPRAALLVLDDDEV
jgi:PAS domain-containing protein